ncbi:tars protein [Thamnocephalis sphaerospora]|uniref:Threonine--tRNA ligase, cytoplasmic n=1 Tax=Thamnocephalis sphaerospora TaxID=78915 RepID=A0A4P9XLB4_9FUNG|nr:tars protein [Thamnocephalis sphaerospora]|eukprot:RKP06595.1 tars protein [Thamnocephalis sphaerospora]
MADLSVKDAAPAPAAKATKKAKKNAAAGSGHALELSPAPEYLAHRIKMFEELKAAYDEEVQAKERTPIVITLPDGSKREGTAWETSPMDIAKALSKSLSERVVIAKVDGQLWDLPRPLEASCQLQLLDFEDDEGKRVFWHSSAHILGEASERHYGCHLCIGPPTDEGFFYEMATPEHRPVTQADYPALETLAKNIIKEKQPFERLVVSKENLLKMFQHNQYKVHLINSKIPDGTSTTVYRCGPLIDLCVGPHVPTTGRVKAFSVLKNSASYFLGDSNNDSLQRIYGISFPDSKQMTQYKKFLEEAAKRDHRKIGQAQELFMFHELSPGSCFFLPHGARIYNALMDFIKAEYRNRGYEEVMTPNIYNIKLWEQSGHWQNYQENMFSFEVEKEKFALKPMNCPGHCLMFGHRDRSYRELPIRMADFGVLHRNEASGALTGLTRVRRFQQDDAHLFCAQDQIETEITDALNFMRKVYGILGFTFRLKLSTRPDKYLGEIETWDKAEKMLANAMDTFGEPWSVDPGDGAFYGPKIDITIADALNRKHQCATFQLDFQLPERFNLQFRTAERDADGGVAYQRPVIIHRAIYGSVERTIAILTEHFAGKWPFWLSPRQIMVVPVTGTFYEYAEQVRQACHDAGFYADADLGENTMNKKIRNAEIAQYNFIFVVGQEEASTNSVNVRNRDDAGTKAKGQTHPLEGVIAALKALKEEKRLESRV